MSGRGQKGAFFLGSGAVLGLAFLALWQLFFPARGAFFRLEATSFGVLCQTLEFLFLWGGITLLLGARRRTEDGLKRGLGRDLEGENPVEDDKKAFARDGRFADGVFGSSVGLVGVGGLWILAGQGTGVLGWAIPFSLCWGILFSWGVLGLVLPEWPRGLACVVLGAVLGLATLTGDFFSPFYKAYALLIAEGGMFLGALFLAGGLWGKEFLKREGAKREQRGKRLKKALGLGEFVACGGLLFLLGVQVILPQEREAQRTLSARQNLEQGKHSSAQVGEAVFVVENPILDKRGEEIYVQLGCVLCHTQKVTQGSEWRLGWSAGREKEGAREIVPRESLVEDYEGSFVAPLGGRLSARGGDLSYLAEEIENKLLSEDREGKPVRYGRVEEWLALFLYSPRETQWGNRHALCPPCPFLFEEKPQYSLLPNEWALPLKTRAGVQIVPTEKGRLLITYLASLKKEGRLSPLSRQKLALLNRKEESLLLTPPASLWAKVDEAQVFARLGAKVFSSQCSVCHGADGTGDGQNYPPLQGSEWVDLPSSVLAELILRGVRGPLSVAGKSWDNYMTPHKGRLTNKEVAAVIAYVQQNFGSQDAEKVAQKQQEKDFEKKAAQQVEEVRQRVLSLGPMSQQELKEKSPKN